MFTLKQIKLNNGVTLDKSGLPLSYTCGYQVSEKDLEIIPAYRLTKKHLIDMLNKLPKGANLGVWIDNNKAYIDQSIRVLSKKYALKVGKALNQISIYDWKTGDCIPCR